MTTLYLVRHGQTENNVKASFNGCHSDQPLDAMGVRQAASLTAAFADKPLDVIYASPLRRAVMTAEGVRGTRELPIQTVFDLREMDMGLLDGVTFEETKKNHAEVWYNWHSDPERLRMPEGESFLEAQTRVYAAVLEILRRERGKAVAVVAHGTVLSLLVTRLFGFSLAERRRVPYLHNAAYHELVFDDDGCFSPVRLRVIEHMSQELFLTPPAEIDEQAFLGKYPVATLKE